MLILLYFILKKFFVDWILLYSVASKTLKSELRETRKHQTIRETTFAMRGNSKPFGKRLSQCAEMPNHLRRDLRKAHKRHKQKKRPFDCSNERSDKKEAATYSPALHCSTIGASGLNFSVRNGKRWDPTAITTWCIFLVDKNRIVDEF